MGISLSVVLHSTLEQNVAMLFVVDDQFKHVFRIKELRSRKYYCKDYEFALDDMANINKPASIFLPAIVSKFNNIVIV